MIRQREEELFREWKKYISADAGAVFVTDGVVDEKAWSQANIKVLYLL